MSPTRRPRPPKLSAAKALTVGTSLVLLVDREMLSPNRSYWAHWRVKHRDRTAWEATIKSALVGWIDSQARTRAARLGVAAEILTGKLAPAPPGRYVVSFARVCRRRAHFISDDDNLAFSAKPVLDALQSCGLIYSDAREYLERPTIRQSTIEEECRETPATFITIEPFWRLMTEGQA